MVLSLDRNINGVSITSLVLVLVCMEGASRDARIYSPDEVYNISLHIYTIVYRCFLAYPAMVSLDTMAQYPTQPIRQNCRVHEVFWVHLGT